MSNKFLTCKQVAEILQVTEKTLKNWRDNGVLPATKIGRSIRYNESDIIKATKKSNHDTIRYTSN